jgi:hypothetical protein
MLKACCFGLILITGLNTTNATAQDQSEQRCIVPDSPSVNLERDPNDFLNIGIDVGIAYEGFLTIGGSIVGSPTGDFTITAGPYDPSNGRLYIWGYFRNGWVNVHNLERGVIRPSLHQPISDIEDVTFVRRSEALGVQFYSGWTAPHWFTRRQSFRVFMISGNDMTRVPELEELQLHYVGDDPVLDLAVFASGSPRSLQYDDPVWFDGTKIVPRPEGWERPVQRCRIED